MDGWRHFIFVLQIMYSWPSKTFQKENPLTHFCSMGNYTFKMCKSNGIYFEHLCKKLFTWRMRSCNCCVLALIRSILLALSNSNPFASWIEFVGRPNHRISFFSLLIIFMAIKTFKASYTRLRIFFWSYCWSVGEVHLKKQNFVKLISFWFDEFFSWKWLKHLWHQKQN